MLFTTDKQTLDDLAIFGKNGSDSVFAAFNKTATRGGAALLDQMFRQPLVDHHAINWRSSIMQYFASADISFPFNREDLDIAEQYLSNTDERTKLTSQEHSFSKKLVNLVSEDADKLTINKGIFALINLLKSLHNYISALHVATEHPLQNERNDILKLLAEQDFAVFMPEKSKWSAAELASLDLIFRFRQQKLVCQLLQHIYQLDVFLTVGKVAKQRQFAFPHALPKEERLMEIEGVYHVLFENAVTNSVKISSENNVIFLTGANMAGKSTLMKSISVTLYLAHMGFPVPAHRMNFSVMDGIYTTINLSDDLETGASHFYAEVLRAKKVARDLQFKNLFVVFDELFRGTNVKDAYEATIAITAGFAAKRNSMFLISTHVIESGEILRGRHQNIRFLSLPTLMEGIRPVYTYKLEDGISSDRHGMVIINNEHILEILQAGVKKIKR